MPDTQAILAVAWGLILAHFVTESQILWCMGLAFFSKPFAIYSIFSRIGPTQKQFRRLLP
jgi:hypothetical protein